jgi:hypothetical protein
MRLNFLHLFGRELRNGKPVIEAALKQAVQEWKFRRFGGNDHLSADFMLDAVLAAKLDH